MRPRVSSALMKASTLHLLVLSVLTVACTGTACPPAPAAAGWDPLVPLLSHPGANVCAQGEPLTPTDGLFVQMIEGDPGEVAVAYESSLLDRGWNVTNRVAGAGGGSILTVSRPDQPGYFTISIGIQLGERGVTRITTSHGS